MTYMSQQIDSLNHVYNTPKHAMTARRKLMAPDIKHSILTKPFQFTSSGEEFVSSEACLATEQGT